MLLVREAAAIAVFRLRRRFGSLVGGGGGGRSLEDMRIVQSKIVTRKKMGCEYVEILPILQSSGWDLLVYLCVKQIYNIRIECF